MLSNIFFLAITLLTTLVSASTDPALQITDLSITKVAGGNVTLYFNVYDPDPLTKAKTNCTGTWKAGSKDYPTGGYAPCADPNFGWNFGAFTSTQIFTLQLTHTYEDPAVGQYPYDIIETFSHANFTTANHPCKTMKGKQVCAQQANTVVSAPVWGVD